MRRIALFASVAAGLALAGAANAQTVNVQIGGQLSRDAEKLGAREVAEQADRLAEVVERALARDARFEGAVVNVTLTELKPNRPTFQQLVDQPGLDAMRSVSIGGAAIEGEVILADGTRTPVRYDWFSHSIADVRGFTTWQDADRAYARFAAGLTSGRLL